jgi:predicted RNase H-like HicB family nuclease
LGNFGTESQSVPQLIEDAAQFGRVVKAQDMKLKVLIYEDRQEGGYTAVVPGLPGCVTEGETMDELLAMVREVVEGWLETTEEVETQRQQDAEGQPDRVLEVEV